MFIRKNDSGRSIVEMLGVLAIMGVITVMGIAGYSQAIGKINRNNTVEQITRLAQEVRSLFASRTTYNSSDSLTSEENYDIGTELLKRWDTICPHHTVVITQLNLLVMQETILDLQ